MLFKSLFLGFIMISFGGCMDASKPPKPFVENPDGDHEAINGTTLLRSQTGGNLIKYVHNLSNLDAAGDEDNDGLTNEFEQQMLQLRGLPDVADSDGDGVDDAHEDFDDDNLTNLEEQTLKTNPLKKDSDDDGIDDYTEAKVEPITDPNKKDTDGDGLEDGDELVVGTEPLVKDTDKDGILDGDEIFTTSKVGDNGIKITVTGKGNAARHVSIDSNSSSLAVNIPGIIGGIIDLNSDLNITDANLSIPLTEKMKNDVGQDLSKIKIAYLDEVTKQIVYPQPQGITADEKYIWIGLSHFSSYFLINTEEFDKAFQGTFYGSTRAGTGGLDLVLLIDSSGSMNSNDPSNLRISAGETLITGLTAGLDRVAVIDFDRSTTTLQALTSDLAAASASLSHIDSSGGTDIGSAVRASIDIINASQSGNSPLVILLTDGDGDYTESLTQEAKDAGIRIYTVGLGDGVNTTLLTDIATGTDGIYYQVANATDLSTLFDQLREETLDTDGDGLSDLAEIAGMRNWYGYVIKTAPDNNDSDGDGLLDGAEMNGVGRAADGKMKYNMISDPTKKDTDGDTLSDYDELNPPQGKVVTDPLRKDTDGDGINDNLDKNANDFAISKKVSIPCKVSTTVNAISASESTGVGRVLQNFCRSVNWGDGSFINMRHLVKEGDALIHTYTKAGTYTVTYTAMDDDPQPMVERTVTKTIVIK